MDIRQWVEATFAGPEAKTFLELGAHRGTDTTWMAAIPGVHIHAFEPDPRNDIPNLPNVTAHRMAIGAHDGPGRLIQSAEGWGQEWTFSSSIRPPKHHLDRYPVTFRGEVDISVATLDRFCVDHGIDTIDFIWADIQGAEGDMICGGRRTLAHTRYLYTEWSDDELYEGQSSLSELVRMLPDFRVVELWPNDVLLENTRPALG
jgi:FkbM family methyltransferase